VKYFVILVLLIFTSAAFAATEGELNAGMENPGYYEKPDWFKQSFMDLPDDLEDAQTNRKRLILYFHQDGCPYCKKLLDINFKQQDIVEKMKQHYEILDINMWGDRSMRLPSGEEVTEKEFAQRLKVMFTPTLIALKPDGDSLFRINGYYAPDKFLAVLDYLLLFPVTDEDQLAPDIPKFAQFYRNRKQSQSTMKTASKTDTKAINSQKLITEKFIVQETDLQKLFRSSSKPVLLLFEQSDCLACTELHGDIFRRMEVYKKLKQFTIAQINIHSEKMITAPDGRELSQKAFAESMNIQYTPSLVFYSAAGNDKKINPVFRSEAYLKTFHVSALLDYISTEAYLSEPEFQRFVQQRAEKMREDGLEVNLWD
jgi:thioredoxin-related protein